MHFALTREVLALCVCMYVCVCVASCRWKLQVVGLEKKIDRNNKSEHGTWHIVDVLANIHTDL